MNKEEHREYSRSWYQKNKKECQRKSRNYYHKNKREIIIRQKIYKLKNKDKIREYNRQYQRKRLKDPQYHKERLKYLKDYYRIKKNHDKETIRRRTRRKYGVLPKGYEYHHPTEPYNIDVWLGVPKEEHWRWHNIG